MGIKKRIAKLRSKEPTASGSQTGSEGRTSLSAAADKLEEMRGDNVSINNDPAAPGPGGDQIAKTVETAKGIRIVNNPSEGRLLGDS